jgi:hypothetical protein
VNAVVERDGIEKVGPQHEAMIDMLLAKPAITHAEIAGEIGYHEDWVRKIIGSPVFKQRLAERRREMFAPLLSGFAKRNDELHEQATRFLLEKFANGKATEATAVRLVETTSRALIDGQGDKPLASDRTNHIESLFKNLEAVWKSRHPTTVDGEVISSCESPPGASS